MEGTMADDASRKGSPPRQKPINNEEVEFKESKVPAMGDERVSEEDQFEEEVERVSSTFSERSSFDMKDMKARTAHVKMLGDSELQDALQNQMKQTLFDIFNLFDMQDGEKHDDITTAQCYAAMRIVGCDMENTRLLASCRKYGITEGCTQIRFEQFYKVVTQHVDEEAQWHFRQSLSYWMAVSTLIGSVLFTLGSFFWLFDDAFTDAASQALITYPFVAGAILFSVACYIGYFEVINDDEDELKFFRNRWGISEIGSLVYFVGTLWFGISCFAGPFHATYVDRANEDLLVWIPSVIGCICFNIGAGIECYHNQIWNIFGPQGILTPIWWLCMSNVFGSVLFMVAATSGLFNLTTVEQNNWVCWPYTIGSFMFVIGSFIQLLMWKQNLFGGGWMNSLVEKRQVEEAEGQPMVRAEATYFQGLFLMVYITGLSLSVVELSFAMLTSDFANSDGSFFGLLIQLGVIALGSVLHNSPPTYPYNYLFWALRVWLFCYMLLNAKEVYHIANYCRFSSNFEDACKGMVYNTDA